VPGSRGQPDHVDDYHWGTDHHDQQLHDNHDYLHDHD